MTDAEGKLWNRSKNRQLFNLKFRRQVPCGPYYLDFHCPEKSLSIEIDGGQHFTREGRGRDKKREVYLLNKNLRTLRYTDTEVLRNLEGVLQDIFNAVNNL